MENTHKTSRRTRSDETFMRSRKNENLKLETSSAQPLLQDTMLHNICVIPNPIFEVGSGVGELQIMCKEYIWFLVREKNE